MKKIVPDYYKEFKCIADKCRHNCCIGWEIDIDDDTLELYMGMDDDLGRRIMSCVDMEDTPHFRLAKGDRCPNLRPDGLCEIICRLGDRGICEICREHPRFRYSYSDREEIGLGLCCEEAARLILTRDEQVMLVTLDGGEGSPSEDEVELFALRDRILDIIQNRKRDIDGRISELMSALSIELSHTDTASWCDFFLSLERLDEAWTDLLEELKTSGVSELDRVSCTLPGESAEQLLTYFIYRHLSPSVETGDVNERVLLAILSFYMIRAVYSVMGTSGVDVLCEIARMYSSEIEYSTDNLDEVLLELSF